MAITEKEIERGLTNKRWIVRLEFARRADYTPTPAQIERGLTDEYGGVQYMFEQRQPEWQAKREAAELKKRHADVVPTKPKLEAL